MLKINNKTETNLGDLGNMRRLVYFTAVVETGSFTAAAERLGITKAVVSQQVARLEQEFRVSLLVRTTRSVKVTDVGQTFYQRCVLILREAEEAFDELTDTVLEPSGTLRIAAPFDYGIGIIVPTIAAFTRHYPNCRVDAALSDQTVDIMSGQVELAIRVGWLSEDNLPVRRIGEFQQFLVVSKSLHAQLPEPLNLKDLSQLPFIANTALNNPLRWNFLSDDGEQQSIEMQASIYLDATLAVREAVLADAGISVLPDYAIADDLAAGRLIKLLPQWQLPSGDIHVVFPSARFRPAKVRAFVDLLIEKING